MFVKLLAAVALTFSCAAASASIDAVTPIHQWATTPLQAEARFTQLSDLAFNSSLCNAVQPPSTATVDVYPDKLLQPIVGFGAALTETTAYNFIKLRDRNQSAYNELLQSLFASSEHGGIGISFLRIPITSCDLSLPTPGWSFDDVDGDVTLQHFNSTHIEAWQIPVLKDIMALTKTHGAAVRLLGSPWSAPAWMKNSKAWGYGRLIDDLYPVYANYLVKVAKYFDSQGLTLWGITLQNESVSFHCINNRIHSTRQAHGVLLALCLC